MTMVIGTVRDPQGSTIEVCASADDGEADLTIRRPTMRRGIVDVEPSA